jgi:hypothetical protein
MMIYGFGSYGWTVFVAVPSLLGYLSVALFRLSGPRRLRQCLAVACGAAMSLSLAFLLTGREGVICIAMTFFLALPLVIIGAVIAYSLFHRKALHALPMLVIVVLLVVGAGVVEGNLHRQAPEFVRSDSMIVNAAPETVWASIVGLDHLPPPRDWVLRSGIACPESTRITRSGVGGTRICTLSTGTLRERISVWSPGRRLRWIAETTPPPLREINPFGEVDAPHLHGFYTNTQGEFALQRLGPGRTLVTRRTWYRHNLYPSEYWRLWSDFAASRVHKFVLRELKARAEKTVSAQVHRS